MIGRRLRRYFITGLVVITPVGLTAWVLAGLFQFVDAILGEPLRAALGRRIPGVGFVLLLLIVFIVGWLVHRTVFRRVLHWWNVALSRFPLTGRIYTVISQIVQTVVGEKRQFFRRTVLVPYPAEGTWAVAFVTSEDAPAMSAVIGEPCVNVFMPTTPNPTSGFLMVVPRAKVIDTQISVEEAMKLVLSAGAVSPTGVPLVEPRRGLDLDSLLKDSQA
ncbi:MAG: DUF502 domain-containing protein [Gemmatimonadales bacterium]